MLKCKCETMPVVKAGKPVKNGDKAYWKQVFVCNDPNCSEHGKEIGERLVNIFDETEIIETKY